MYGVSFPLTLALSLGEREKPGVVPEPPSARQRLGRNRRQTDCGKQFPLPAGEGQGEGKGTLTQSPTPLGPEQCADAPERSADRKNRDVCLAGWFDGRASA